MKKKRIKQNPMKTKITKSLLFLGLVFVVNSSLLSQTNPVTENIVPGQYFSDWKVFKSLELVDIFYKYSDCSDPANGVYTEQILFKVVNKTENKIYLYWEYELEYNNQPTRSSEDENLVQIQLEANQSMEGSCTKFHKTRLEIFYRYKDRDGKLTGLRFKNINEYKIN